MAYVSVKNYSPSTGIKKAFPLAEKGNIDFMLIFFIVFSFSISLD